MRVRVRVKPSSRRPGVDVLPDGLLVRVNAPPIEGRANHVLLEMLAHHFSVPKSRVRIVTGKAGRTKVIEVKDP